jgi:hypothetical protein
MEVKGMMYALQAGSSFEKDAVLLTLSQLPTRCPEFLLPLAAGFAGSDSCALIRVYRLLENKLPLQSKLAIGTALLNMSSNNATGSLWAFIRERQDDAIEIDDSESLDLANKVPVSLALEAVESLPGPRFGPGAVLPDGHTVAEHCAAWSRYWKTYFRSRALFGVNVEVASTIYSKYFMEELACMHDLTQDAQLRALVADYMQLYFADAATEFLLTANATVSGQAATRGGAKARVYHDHYFFDDSDPIEQAGWLFGWMGDSFSRFANNTFGWYYIHIAATDWRPLPQLKCIAISKPAPFMWTSYIALGVCCGGQW